MEKKYETSPWEQLKKSEIKKLLSYYKKGNNYLLFLKAQYEKEYTLYKANVDFFIEEQDLARELKELLKIPNYIANTSINFNEYEPPLFCDGENHDISEIPKWFFKDWLGKSYNKLISKK